MSIEIKTLTPIWTGGVKGNCDILHETGIIGSMRWWYEAIVRGLGGYACDPSKHQCPDDNGNYCDACLIFGATGLKRSFRIDLERLQNNNPNQELHLKVNNNRGWYFGCGVYSKQLKGHIIPIRSIDCVNSKELYQILALTLQLATKYGGLGPRTQQGYGVMDITTQELEINTALEALKKCIKSSNKKQIDRMKELPRFNKFFFSKVRFSIKKGSKEFFCKSINLIKKPTQVVDFYDNNKILLIAPIVRYHLRGLIRDNIKYKGHSNSAARWRLMGVLNGRYHMDDFGKVEEIEWMCPKCKATWTNKPNRYDHINCRVKPRISKYKCIACGKIWENMSDLKSRTKESKQMKSLIHVSNAYLVGDKYEFRIWGWIPPTLPGDVPRRDVLKKLRNWLEGINDNTGILWDKIHCNINDIEVEWFEIESGQETDKYLHSLLTKEVFS